MSPPISRRHRRHELLSVPPSLHPGQTIGRVTRACGENIYEVQNEHSEHSLYQLPKRLRHVAFIKRGSFVFIRVDDSRRVGRVKGDIECVVLDRYLPSLRNESFWPAVFARDGRVQQYAHGQVERKGQDEDGEGRESERSEVSDDDWEIGSGNPNRQKWDHVSSEEDSDSS